MKPIIFTKKEAEYILWSIRVELDSYITNREKLPEKYKNLQLLDDVPEIVWKKAILSEDAEGKEVIESIYKKITGATVS